jgi:hypothetical protein
MRRAPWVRWRRVDPDAGPDRARLLRPADPTSSARERRWRNDARAIVLVNWSACQR